MMLNFKIVDILYNPDIFMYIPSWAKTTNNLFSAWRNIFVKKEIKILSFISWFTILMIDAWPRDHLAKQFFCFKLAQVKLIKHVKVEWSDSGRFKWQQQVMN